MSVESEILRIQHNIADTYAVVSSKGGDVPLQPNSENLAAAVASIPASSGTFEVYSTEETRIGTWADGKPLYSMTFLNLKLPSTVGTEKTLATVPSDKNVKFLDGMFLYNDQQSQPLNAYIATTDTYVYTFYRRGDIIAIAGKGALDKECWVTIKYTKTTD